MLIVEQDIEVLQFMYNHLETKRLVLQLCMSITCYKAYAFLTC